MLFKLDVEYFEILKYLLCRFKFLQWSKSEIEQRYNQAQDKLLLNAGNGKDCIHGAQLGLVPTESLVAKRKRLGTVIANTSLHYLL